MTKPYAGYLASHVALIRQRHASHVPLKAIAEELFELGARSTNNPYLNREESIRSFTGLIRKVVLRIPTKRQLKDEILDIGY